MSGALFFENDLYRARNLSRVFLCGIRSSSRSFFLLFIRHEITLRWSWVQPSNDSRFGRRRLWQDSPRLSSAAFQPYSPVVSSILIGFLCRFSPLVRKRYLFNHPACRGFRQHGITRMWTAIFHLMRHRRIIRIGWQSNASGIDDQASIRQLNGVRNMAVSTQDHSLTHRGKLSLD